MIKKDLLAMKKLTATKQMIKTAEENPIETKKIRTSWGCNHTETKSKYARYFRISIEDGILKVAIFSQNKLQQGDKTPIYEVYCNKTKDEYMTYEPGEDKWRKAKIDNLTYPGITYLYQSENWQQDKDRKAVNEYFETGLNKDIYAAVLDFQAAIKKDQLQKKHRSELEEIDEVMREVPEVPRNFNDWIAKNCFREIMFYEPESKCHYRYPRMYCTHCKQWMDTLGFPNRPGHNKEGKCPRCGVNIKYKSWNKQKYVTDETDVGLLQRLKDNSGWILRSFNCRIKREHDKGWENYEIHVFEESRERLDDTFRQVEFFEFGEYKYTGVDRWCHNCRRSHFSYGYYYYPQEIEKVVMYTPNLKRELRREAFSNIDFKKIMKGGERKRVDPKFILRKLRQHPYIEYIQKSSLNILVNEIMNDKEDMSLFDNTKFKINDVLKLEKQKFQRFKKLNGGCRTLTALQYEQQTGQKVSDENISLIETAKVDVKEVIDITEKTGMNLERTLNYLKKQMKIEEQSWTDIFRHYKDYLEMAAVFDMDITDEIVCRQPKLMEYHNRYAERKNRQKNRSRDKEVDLKYPKIKENRKKFKERFEFKTEEFEIVVPKKASDITREGRLQHHCVGASDTYISNMNSEKYFILFLRKRCNLKNPYYTLEVSWDGDIMQYYAAYDRQPDKEKITAVLDEFTKQIKIREAELEKKMHEVEKRDGLKAVRIGTQWEMYEAETI